MGILKKVLLVAALAALSIGTAYADTLQVQNWTVEVWNGSGLNKNASQAPGADRNDSYYKFSYSGPIDFYVGGGENNTFANFFNGNVNSTKFSSGSWNGFSWNGFSWQNPLQNQIMSNADNSDSPISTYIKFTGDLTLKGTSILSVTHDDGVALKIDNIWQSGFTSGETARDVDTATVRDGLHHVELDYVEANGAPSILSVSQTPAVPEPASLLLLGSGLASIGGLIRRKIGK